VDSSTLPGGLRGVERVVLIALERLRHVRVRRPQWIEFVMRFMRDTIKRPDFLGSPSPTPA